MNPTHRLNNLWDIGMIAEMRDYVGQNVEFVKVCKSGLIQIRTSNGKLFSVRKRNLDPLDDGVSITTISHPTQPGAASCRWCGFPFTVDTCRNCLGTGEEFV